MVEVPLSVVEGMQQMLVPVNIKIQPLGVHHEEEHVLVPPQALVVFMSL